MANGKVLPRVLVGVPYVGQVAGPFYQSMVALFQEHHRRTLDLDAVAVPDSAVHLARDALVKHFLRSGRDYLVMVDADQVFHPNCVPRLVGWGKPYVAALIITRRGPPTPVAFAHERFRETPEGPQHLYSPLSEEVWAYLSRYAPERLRNPGGTACLPPMPDHVPTMEAIPNSVQSGLRSPLLAVDGVGTGMVCLSRECAERIDPGPANRYFDWEAGGEDLSFSRRVLKAGYAGFHPDWTASSREHGVFVDRGCLVGHLAYYARSVVDLAQYLRHGRFDGALPDAPTGTAADLAAEIEAEEARAQALDLEARVEAQLEMSG